MTRNLPDLKDIANDPASIRSLSLETLDALLGECDVQTRLAGVVKKAICSQLEQSYGGDITHAYAVLQKDFGTVRVSDGPYEIVVDTPKKVEWDGEKVAEIGDAMLAAGDNPQEYIKVSYSVDERKFTAWPEHIRKVFEPARTLKPGSRTLKLVRKEAA